LPLWLLVVFTCERTSSGKMIWIRRRYQHCCHCHFKASKQGQIESFTWSFTVYKGKVCGQCWWLHWLEDICLNIQEYK
jgi:hypothetical protein